MNNGNCLGYIKFTILKFAVLKTKEFLLENSTKEIRHVEKKVLLQFYDEKIGYK